MEKNIDFDLLPEETVVICGESLLTRRHMPTPPNLLTAIRSPQDPVRIYEILREEYPADHPLWLKIKTNSRELALADLQNDPDIFQGADYLVIPPLPDGNAFETFQNTVAALRAPDGCPWDRKQTHQSLRDDFLQEVYELLDGLDRADREIIVEELGDVLLHIVLQAQIGIDNGEFNMGDVISHINSKIIYRHPHVFANLEGVSEEQVPGLWEQIKQKEREKKHKKGGLLDGINRSMPALSMAWSYQKRAAKAGFDWDNDDAVWGKFVEEVNEFKSAETPEAQEEELGDILFSLVNLARRYEIDPETALRMANLKFYKRFRLVEEKAREQGKDLFDISPEEKVKYWNESKSQNQNRE